MLLPSPFKQPAVQLRVGLALLVIALFGRQFLRPTASLTPDRLDGLLGFLLGLAIGAMLLALFRGRLQRRPGAGSGSDPMC
jgi:hypothetical protein